MANTYTLIGSPIVVGSGGASSAVFSSIPNTFTDLQLLCSTRNSTSATQDLKLTFNGSSSSYNEIYLIGTGSGTGSGSQTYAQVGITPGSSVTASTFTNTSIYIPNYAGSNYKSISNDDVMENNATLGYQWLSANLWSNTAAITSITLIPASGNFVQYSTFYLYGISNS
jgi:hypothetical protein